MAFVAILFGLALLIVLGAAFRLWLAGSRLKKADQLTRDVRDILLTQSQRYVESQAQLDLLLADAETLDRWYHDQCGKLLALPPRLARRQKEQLN
jgi:hypothetical protein